MGYIDKFYSSDIYPFDNKKAVISIIRLLFDSTVMVTKGNDDKNIFLQLYFEDNFLFDLISKLIFENIISLRNIIKLFHKEIRYHYEEIIFEKNSITIFAWRVPVIFQLKLLTSILGDFRTLKKVFDQISLSDEFAKKHSMVFGHLIYLINYSTHNFLSRNNLLLRFGRIDIVMDAQTTSFSDRLQRTNLFQWNHKMIDETNADKGPSFKVTTELFKLALIEAAQLLHNCRYLN